jgi:hypothetical protein
MRRYLQNSCASALILYGAVLATGAQSPSVRLANLTPPREEHTQEPHPVKLPTGGQLVSVEGAPRAVNSFPVSVAPSPDGRYAVTMNDGYGTAESKFRQSLGVVDLQSNEIKDYTEERLGRHSHQSYFLGLQFSPDGHAAFEADYRNRDNGVIYTMNPPNGPDAQASQEMDFSEADRADAGELNKILWLNRMGLRPIPPIQHQVFPAVGRAE